MLTVERYTKDKFLLITYILLFSIIVLLLLLILYILYPFNNIYIIDVLIRILKTSLFSVIFTTVDVDLCRTCVRGAQIADVKIAMDTIRSHHAVLHKAIAHSVTFQPFDRNTLQKSMDFVSHEAALYEDNFNKTNLGLDNVRKARDILDCHLKDYSMLTNKEINGK